MMLDCADLKANGITRTTILKALEYYNAFADSETLRRDRDKLRISAPASLPPTPVVSRFHRCQKEIATPE